MTYLEYDHIQLDYDHRIQCKFIFIHPTPKHTCITLPVQHQAKLTINHNSQCVEGAYALLSDMHCSSLDRPRRARKTEKLFLRAGYQAGTAAVSRMRNKNVIA